MFFRNNTNGITGDLESKIIIEDNTFISNKYPVRVYDQGIDNNISGNEYFNNVDENGNSSDYIYVLGNDDAERLRESNTYDWGGRWCAL